MTHEWRCASSNSASIFSIARRTAYVCLQDIDAVLVLFDHALDAGEMALDIVDVLGGVATLCIHRLCLPIPHG